MLCLFIFFYALLGGDATPPAANAVCQNEGLQCSVTSDCCKGLNCFWGKDLSSGGDPRIQRSCLPCKKCNFKLNECAAVCPDLKPPPPIPKIVSPMEKFRPSTTAWPITKEKHKIMVTFLNDYSDVIGTRRDEFLKACGVKNCVDVVALAGHRLQVVFEHKDLNILFKLAAEFRLNGYVVPGFTHLKGADIEGLPATLNSQFRGPLCQEVKSVKDEKFEDTGKDCPSAWAITKKLLPTITSCPPILAVQCPKTCGQCPESAGSVNVDGQDISTEFTFPKADFQALIGDRKAEFLKECSKVLKPIKCIEVRSGSVIITVSGKESDLSKSMKTLSADGLQMPNFGNFGKLLALKSIKPLSKMMQQYDDPNTVKVTSDAATTGAPASTPAATTSAEVTTSPATTMASSTAPATSAPAATEPASTSVAATTSQATSTAEAATTAPAATVPVTTSAASTTQKASDSPAKSSKAKGAKKVVEPEEVLKMRQTYEGERDCEKLAKLVIEVNALAWKVEEKNVKAVCASRRNLFIKDFIDLFKKKSTEETPKIDMDVEVTMPQSEAEKAKKMDEKKVMETVRHGLRKHELMRKKVHITGITVEGHVPKKEGTKAPAAAETTKKVEATTAKAKKPETTKAPTSKSKPSGKDLDPWIGPSSEKAPWDDGKTPLPPPNGGKTDILVDLNIVRATYTFEKRFSKLIGKDAGKKKKFLEECGVVLKPVKCTDVLASESDDVVVKIEGDRVEFKKISNILYKQGLMLTSFGDLGVVGLLPGIGVDQSMFDDDVEPPEELPPFCVDVEDVIDEKGEKTGKACGVAMEISKKKLKIDHCVEQLAIQCPVTCGTCESGPKAINPKAKSPPERIVRIVEAFEDFDSCDRMVKKVKEINIEALHLDPKMVHVRPGKGCEQVTQSMLAYLEMGVHRRRLIDTAQFVVEVVFPVKKAADAEKLAKTSREEMKKALAKVVDKDEAVSRKTTVVNVLAPTMDVCIDVQNVKDEYDQKTGKSCKDTPRDPKSKKCYPHVAIQCPQTCDVCPGPTEAPKKTTKAPTTQAPKPTATQPAKTAAPATTKAPKPVVVLAEELFEGITDCVKSKGAVLKANAKALGVPEGQIKIQKCEHKGKISDFKFGEESRRNLFVGRLFGKKKKAKEEDKSSDGEPPEKPNEPKSDAELPVTYLISMELPKEKADHLEATKIVEDVNKALKEQQEQFKIRKFEISKNGVLTTSKPPETTAVTKAETTHAACKDVEDVVDEKGKSTGKNCDFAVKFIRSKLNREECVPQLAKQCPMSCGKCSPGSVPVTVVTKPVAKCIDAKQVTDEAGLNTGFSCSKAWNTVQKTLPQAKDKGCPAHLATQCPKTCGACHGQGPQDSYKLELTVDYMNVIHDKEKDFLEACKEIYSGVTFVKVAIGEPSTAYLWVKGEAHDLIDFITEALNDEIKVDGFGEFTTTLASISEEAEAELTLEGNYEKIVGKGKRSRFLAECTMKHFPVVCTDVFAGSVKVKIEGKSGEVKSVVDEVAKHGLKLKSFPELEPPGLLPPSSKAVINTGKDTTPPKDEHKMPKPTQTPQTGTILIFKQVYEGIEDCEGIERKIAYLNSQTFHVKKKWIHVIPEEGCNHTPSIGLDRRNLDEITTLDFPEEPASMGSFSSAIEKIDEKFSKEIPELGKRKDRSKTKSKASMSMDDLVHIDNEEIQEMGKRPDNAEPLKEVDELGDRSDGTDAIDDKVKSLIKEIEELGQRSASELPKAEKEKKPQRSEIQEAGKRKNPMALLPSDMKESKQGDFKKVDQISNEIKSLDKQMKQKHEKVKSPWTRLLTQLQGEVKKDQGMTSNAATTAAATAQNTAAATAAESSDASSTAAATAAESSDASSTAAATAAESSDASSTAAATAAESSDASSTAAATDASSTPAATAAESSDASSTAAAEAKPTEMGKTDTTGPAETTMSAQATEVTETEKAQTIAPTVLTTKEEKKSTTSAPQGTTANVDESQPPNVSEVTKPPKVTSTVSFRVELVFPESEAEQEDAVARMTKEKIIKSFNAEIENDYKVKGKIKMVDTTEADRIPFKSSATLTFKGLFSELVGEKHLEFLAECSKALKPVRCIDVYPGSVKVEVIGSVDDVKAAVKKTRENGLKLPSFPPLKSKDKKETTEKPATTKKAKEETTTEKIETTEATKAVETTSEEKKEPVATSKKAETTKEIKKATSPPTEKIETTGAKKESEKAETTAESAEEKPPEIISVETTGLFDEPPTLKARVQFPTTFDGSSEAFITDCGNVVAPVKCTNIKKGDNTVEVEFTGPSDQILAKKLHNLIRYGLELETFEDFPKGVILQVPSTVAPLLASMAGSTSTTVEAQTTKLATTTTTKLATTSAKPKSPSTSPAKQESSGDKKHETKPEVTLGPIKRTGFPIIETKKPKRSKKPKWTVCRDVSDVKTNKGLLSGRTCPEAWDALRRYKSGIVECPKLLKQQCPFTCHDCLSRQILSFDKDYEIVAGKEKQFLKRCSEVASPLKCIDVKKGSILITLEGKSEDLKVKVDTFVNHGLKIEGFGDLGEGLKITPQISGAAPKMPKEARNIIMTAMKKDKEQSVAPDAVVKILLDAKLHVTTITKALFALGITPLDTTLALEGAGVDPKSVSQVLHSLGAPQVPKDLLPQIKALKEKEEEVLPSSVISILKRKGSVALVDVARVLIAVGIDYAVAKKALIKAKYNAREVVIALDDVVPDDRFSPTKKKDKESDKELIVKPPATTTSVAPSSLWTVSFTFLKVRDCNRHNAVGIQLGEILWGDGKDVVEKCNATALETKPSNANVDFAVSNLCDDRNSKWLDTTMNKCGASIKLSGFSFTKMPTHYAFKTAGDSPARDPQEWELEVCNGASCRKAVVHEQLSENRWKVSEWYKAQLFIVSVKIEGLSPGKTIKVMNNHNERNDMLNFDSDGVKQFDYSILVGTEFNVEIVQTPSNLQCTIANGGGIAFRDQYVAIYCVTQKDLDFVYGIRILKTKGCEQSSEHSKDAISFGGIEWQDHTGKMLPYEKLGLKLEPKDLQGNEDLAHAIEKNRQFTSTPSENSGCDGRLFMYGWHFHGQNPLTYRIKSSSKQEQWDVATWELQRCEGHADFVGELADDKKSLKGGNCRKAVVEDELSKVRNQWSNDFSAELFTVGIDMKGWSKGMEVILTNNHDIRGDALRINANGLTVFSYALVKGARYGVSVKKVTKGYKCRADGWSGRISADVVVPVECKKESEEKLDEAVGNSIETSFFSPLVLRVLALITLSFFIIFLLPCQKSNTLQSEKIHLLQQY